MDAGDIIEAGGCSGYTIELLRSTVKDSAVPSEKLTVECLMKFVNQVSNYISCKMSFNCLCMIKNPNVRF